jgi:hypothetical protein
MIHPERASRKYAAILVSLVSYRKELWENYLEVVGAVDLLASIPGEIDASPYHL